MLVNPALQYAESGESFAPNAQVVGKFPHVMNLTAQLIPPGFTYPPHMYHQYAPQFVHVQTPTQVVHQTYPRPTSQGILGASPARRTDYQLLNERIRAIKGFSAFGMDAKDLCLVRNVMLPQKFKVLDLPKYKGLSYPRSHVMMYYRKMASYIDNDDLLVHCFQYILSGASLDWYISLERTKIRSLVKDLKNTRRGGVSWLLESDRHYLIMN